MPPETLSPLPLLAAFDMAWLKLFGFIVVALIYLINKGIQVATKKPQPPPRPPRQPGGAPPRPPSGARGELNDEVAEFLRRSQEKRAGRPAQAEAQAEARTPPTRRLPSQRPAQVVEAVAVDEPPTGARVAEHVARHLDTGDFNQRARELTTVEESVDAMQSHLSQVFSHPLGQLDARSGGAAPAVAPSAAAPAATAADAGPLVLPTADAFAALLANPQNLRNVMILNEILRRPTERW